MSAVAQRLSADRRFEFDSKACLGDTFAVVRMSGFEAISRPYRFELVLVSDDAHLDLASVLAASAELRILAPDGSRTATPYAGMLAEFDQLHQLGGFTFYRAVLVPRLWQMSLYRNSEVYVSEQTIVEILDALLKSARFNGSDDYALKLIGKNYRSRSYVCQYQETPLAFMSRWLEREGIYYYFEQVDGRDQLVLLDDKIVQPAEAVAVNYRPADELDVGLAPDSVQSFVCRTRPLPRRLVLQDFNHRRAGLPLVVEVDVSATGIGEEMLYGENFRTLEEGEHYAMVRAQELGCGARVFTGEATAVGLRSGRFLDLVHHYRKDFDGRYLVTEITHEGSQAGALLAGLKTPYNESEGQTVYRNSFTALPESVQFRPARITPRPRVAGTMNATIDAEGSGENAEIDAYGQYKVQIPFDRTDKGAAKGSAPVRMASPYAGSNHGMHFPLHKGAEVLLSFTDGDPDQPVILSAVPNSENPNVVDSRNPRVNRIRTQGGNEIGLEDTKGQETIWLSSPYNDSAMMIGHSLALKVAGTSNEKSDDKSAKKATTAVYGNILQATKGGSDTVTFGASNLMNFGNKNWLLLGSENNLFASLSNKVTMGFSIAVNFAAEVKWNMNPVPGTSLFKNLTIDDASAVSLKLTADTTAIQSVSFAAGASAVAPSRLTLETELKVLRGLTSAYTGLNLAQSAVFAAAVNGEFHLPEELTGSNTDDRGKDSKDPNPYDFAGFMGWPGILGKFGADAVLSTASLTALQWRAKKLTQKIKALDVMSRMTLDETGIVQVVNKGTADAASIELRPSTGILMKAPEFELETATAASIASAKMVSVIGNDSVVLQAGSGADELVALTLGGNAKNATLGNKHFSLKLDTDTKLIAAAITVGHGTTVNNPLFSALSLQLATAVKAVKETCDAFVEADEEARTQMSEPGKTLANQLRAVALKAWDTARATYDAIALKKGATSFFTQVDVINGLVVDAGKTELTHTATSLKVMQTGVKMKYGVSAFAVDGQGVTASGPLIKLG
jgi:type VI secretion system secreted protein VgrG